MAAQLAPTLPLSTPIAVAGYLRDLRPAIQRLTEARQSFIRRIGTLMEQVRQGDAAGFGEEADLAGRDAAAQFRFARVQVEALPVPAVCLACHDAVISWTDMLIAAADVLAEIGSREDRGRLREVQALLAESRVFSNRFRAEYETLVERLRQRGTAQPAKPRKAPRLLRFGRRG